MSPRLTALLLMSALTWLAPATAGAQSAIIAGIVRSVDGEPINGATVLARTAPSDRPDRTTQTTTNESGRFGFIGLRAGRWIFTIQRLGFEPTQTRATIRRTGRINVSVIWNSIRSTRRPRSPGRWREFEPLTSR